ncbi:MAG: M20/M25/M40 family metallo-hydrolase [Calditrichia bacterium]
MELSTQRLSEIFLDLVRIEAISKQEKPVADYIRAFLYRLGIETIEDNAGIEVGGNTGNIIAKVNSSFSRNSFTVAFAAHMDTVKSTAGIKPSLENGIIKTDGSTILGADNRAGIAMILYVVEYLKTNNLQFTPFEVIFTIGEETGLYGSTHLNKQLVDAEVLYILDSSSDPGYYVISAPEATDFTLKFIGKASHAAVNPEDGINAIKMASRFIEQFTCGRIDNDTTINIGLISGGEATNVIPPVATIHGEIRGFAPRKIQQYIDQIHRFAATIEHDFNGQVQVQTETAFPGFNLQQDHPAIKLLELAMDKNGLQPKPIRYYGGSDANIFNNRGFFAIDLGIGAKNPHSVNEYISLHDMELVVRTALTIILE